MLCGIRALPRFLALLAIKRQGMGRKVAAQIVPAAVSDAEEGGQLSPRGMPATDAISVALLAKRQRRSRSTTKQQHDQLQQQEHQKQEVMPAAPTTPAQQGGARRRRRSDVQLPPCAEPLADAATTDASLKPLATDVAVSASVPLLQLGPLQQAEVGAARTSDNPRTQPAEAATDTWPEPAGTPWLNDPSAHSPAGNQAAQCKRTHALCCRCGAGRQWRSSAGAHTCS